MELAAVSARLFMGVGLRTQASASSLQTLWQQAQAVLPPHWHLQAVATLALRARHPALQQWLATQAWPPALAAAPPALAAQRTLTQSAHSLGRYGCGSVAEAAALWAATQHGQAGAQLLHPRWVAADGCATLALAIAT